MAQAVLRVEGMSCGHCKNAVEKSLRGVSGVLDASVDLAAKTATVSYEEGKATLNDLEKAVVDAGYEVVH